MKNNKEWVILLQYLKKTKQKTTEFKFHITKEKYYIIHHTEKIIHMYVFTKLSWQGLTQGNF